MPVQTGIDRQYLEWVDQRIAATAADAVRGMQPKKAILHE